MTKPPAKPLTDKDGEVREMTKDDMRRFRPIAEIDPGMVDDMNQFRRKVGRPKAVAPKVLLGFRLSADVVASIKASGPGYNVRVEKILREAGFGRRDPLGPKRAGSKAAAKATTSPAKTTARGRKRKA